MLSTTLSITATAFAGVLFGCGLLGGGAETQTMTSSASVPAGRGTIRATEAGNGNTAIAVRVKHLAPPSKLASDAKVYVVWIRPRNAAIQNVGALSVNDELEGQIDTVTPHRRFTVTVTPEPSGQMLQPTHEPVFTSEVERSD
jgi:hypothetical protein